MQTRAAWDETRGFVRREAEEGLFHELVHQFRRPAWQWGGGRGRGVAMLLGAGCGSVLSIFGYIWSVRELVIWSIRCIRIDGRLRFEGPGIIRNQIPNMIHHTYLVTEQEQEINVGAAAAT